MRGITSRRGFFGILAWGTVGAASLLSTPPPRSAADSSGRSPYVSADTNPIRIVISLAERRLWVVDSANDTLRSAPVAIGTGSTLRSGDSVWRFTTPVGATTVVAKEVNPVWIPPEWHYVELARANGWALQKLDTDHPVKLRSGAMLRVAGRDIGLIGPDSVFSALPDEEELVFDGTLFVPPFGTRQRRVEGVLGPFRLLLANGVGLHGTPLKETIGKAATHGCIRLHDEDITWLYDHVPKGTRVIIY